MTKKILMILNIISIIALSGLLLGMYLNILRIDTTTNTFQFNQKIYYHNDNKSLNTWIWLQCSFNTWNNISNSFGGKQTNRIYVNYWDTWFTDIPYSSIIDMNIINNGSWLIIESSSSLWTGVEAKQIFNDLGFYQFVASSNISTSINIANLTINQQEFDWKMQAVLSIIYNIKEYNEVWFTTLMWFCNRK